MNQDTLLLIDLNSLARPIFEVSGKEPDQDWTSTQIVSRVRGLASAHPHAAICTDCPPYDRKAIDPAYKANRDATPASYTHQVRLAQDVLRADGFPVWAVKGLEADDLIASAVKQATAIEGTSVLIVSADKDLLALVSERVSVKNAVTGNINGPADVFDKFGVRPEQIPDLLALMGDSSDNIKGAEKIGKVIGARLLSEHGTLTELFRRMDQGVVAGVTPAMRTNLLEFKNRWPTVAALIALRTDAEIPFHEIAVEREAPAMSTDEPTDARVPFENSNDANDAPLPWTEERELGQNDALAALSQATARVAERIAVADSAQPVKLTPQGRIVSEQPASLQPYQPVDFSQQLEPRSMDDAVKLAQRAFESRLFGAFGTPQAVLMAVLAGRELGLSAMASLRAIYVIEGKPTLSADTMRAVVLKSGLAEYFRCTETTPERATFETKRKGEPAPISMTFTMSEAQTAGVVKKGSGWEKYPGDMLRARASAKLCRLTYPDVISGLYDPSEIG